MKIFNSYFLEHDDIEFLLRKAEKPIPYPFIMRLRDRAQARRDAKSGNLDWLKTAPPSGDGLVSKLHTPYLLSLSQQCEDAVLHEDQVFIAMSKKPLAELEKCTTQVERAKASLEQAKDAVDRLKEQTVDQIAEKRVAERRTNTSDLVTQKRRQREYRKNVTGPAHAKLRNAQVEYDQVRMEQTSLEAQLKVLKDVLALRQERVKKYYQRRVSYYENICIQTSGLLAQLSERK